MSSPLPEVLKINLKDDDDAAHAPTNTQVEDMYKSSYKKFVDAFNIHNNKVRYYCNKTLCMRQPLNEILDDLVNIQYNVMAYLPQDTLDHYALSMVFILISKTASLIEWSNLNHDCFWKDFCRETKVLRHLISQAQMSTFECVHTIVDKANRAMEVLKEVVPQGNKITDIRLKSTLTQSSGDPTTDSIKVIWMESRETIIIQWKDPEEDELQSVKLQQTCDSFKLRFLRCLTFHARKCLEQFSLTMLRIDRILRHEFQLQKLTNCQGLLDAQLMPHERAALSKSKRQFDGTWDDILSTVCRFKMQLQQLEKHKGVFKRQLKSVKSHITVNPSIEALSVLLEDPLIQKIISQGITREIRKESFDFTMYPDRTEDILVIIQDIWSMEKTNYKKMDLLLILTYSALSQIHEVLNKEEQKVFCHKIYEILIQRNSVKKYLKKALTVLKHKAFQELALSGSKRLRSAVEHGRSRTDASLHSIDDLEPGNDYNGNATHLPWVQLQGGFQVTIGAVKEFLVMNQFKGQNQFGNLDEDQKVALTTKMLNRLLHFVSIESCQAKIICDRSFEIKSLVKRLKPRDRTMEPLINSVEHGVNHVQQTVRLMKTMNILKTIIKRF